MEKDTRPRSPGRVGEPHDPDSGSWWPLRAGHERSWPLLWANSPSLGELQDLDSLNGRKPQREHTRPPPDPISIDSPVVLSSWVLSGDDDGRGFDDFEPEASKPPASPPAAEAPEPPPAPPPVKKPRKSVLSPEKLAEIDRLLEDPDLSLAEIARRVRAGHATIRQRANLIRPILGRWSHAA